jgi:hypothetical protein
MDEETNCKIGQLIDSDMYYVNMVIKVKSYPCVYVPFETKPVSRQIKKV